MLTVANEPTLVAEGVIDHYFFWRPARRTGPLPTREFPVIVDAFAGRAAGGHVSLVAITARSKVHVEPPLPALTASTLRPSDMTSRVIDLRHVAQEDEEAWRALAERALEPNPFCEPDCLLPAARHQTNGARLRLVVVEEDGLFRACVPFIFTNKRRVPYPQVSASVRRMHWLGTPLVDSTHSVEAVETFLLGLAAARRIHRGRVLWLEWLRADGPVAAAVHQAATRLGFHCSALEQYERGTLDRRPDGEYTPIHGGKWRRNRRREWRVLGERMGGEVKVVDRTDDPAAVEEYLRLEASGYKAQSGVAMMTVAGEPEYFAEMCRRFADAGRLRVFSLECNGQAVAMEVLVRGAEGMFIPKCSYDETYAECSPGVLLQWAVIEQFFHDMGAAWMDTCTYDGNEYVLGLYPDRLKIESLLIVLGHNVVDRAAVQAFCKAKPLHQRLHVMLRVRNRSSSSARPGTDLDPAKEGGGARSQIAAIARSLTRSARRHVRDVQHRLSGAPVPPWRLRSAVPGDFWAVGEEFRGYLVGLGGLQPDDRVLEIGCRVGRMAIPLTRYLGSNGSYEGVDDSVAGTEWCTRAISSRFPNFTFRRVADAGLPKEGLPYEDEMFDFVLFGSIGGLAPDVFSACVNEAARVLRRGRYLLRDVRTWFVGTTGVTAIHLSLAPNRRPVVGWKMWD